MFFVYVLYSLVDDQLYKGFTNNLSKRLKKHNSGGSKSTCRRKPFVLVHVEQFSEKKEGLQREQYLKILEGGSKLKSYLKAQGILNEDGVIDVKR